MGLVIKKEGQFVSVEKISEKALEQEYGELKKVVLPEREVTLEKKETTEANKSFWLRKPLRGELKEALLYATTAQGKTDQVTPGEMIMESCMVAGDDEVKTDDRYYIRASIASWWWLQECVGFF